MANATNPDRSYPLRAAPALAVVTLLTSMLVAFIVTGTPFSTVRIVDLAHWSGLELTAFSIEDSWRLLTAQLVHVKWPHMLFNVVCLALVAGLVERRIGAFGTLLIWALIGGTATAISPLGIDPPYDVGTGASQAVLAFAGYATIMKVRGALKGWLSYVIIALCVIPAFAIDLAFAGYPKIGHLAAFFGAIAAGLLFFPVERARAPAAPKEDQGAS